jgi:hypothetical protein
MRDLPGELQRESDSAVPLHERLERVRRSSEAIWDSPRLLWFTDHTAQGHSEQLIKLLGQILDHLQGTDEHLSRSELFILMCACYLHDIGMQDLVIDERGLEELTVDDYELVRKRHPARGKELIVNRSLQLKRGQFHVDLDDIPGYLQPIAWVSQGHGSDYFEDTIQQLSKLKWEPDGVESQIRAQLLTALLLIADELDIRAERCNFLEEVPMSPISELHHFLNHFAIGTSVTMGTVATRRRVHIHFEFPEGSDHYRPDVRQVLTDKLVRQIRRVNGILDSGTGGELTIEPLVAISEQTDGLKVRRSLEGRALRELQRQAREADLVARQKVVARLRASLGTEAASLISLEHGPESDLSAVLSWAVAEARVLGHRLATISFRPAIGGDPAGTLAQLAAEVGLAEAIPAAVKSPPRRGHPLFEQVVAELGNRSTLLLIEDLDAAEPATQKLVAELVASVMEGTQTTVLACHDGSVGLDGSISLELGPLEMEDLADHLRQALGYGGEEAAQMADDYLTLSGGSAEPITAIISNERRRAQIDE